MLPKLSYKWRVWIHGLIGAGLGSIANSISNALVDPEHFNPLQHGDWNKIGVSLAVAGVIGVALYIKSHPLPDPDKDIDGQLVAEKAIAKLEPAASGTGTGDSGPTRIA